jgi:hypothetical protein
MDDNYDDEDDLDQIAGELPDYDDEDFGLQDESNQQEYYQEGSSQQMSDSSQVGQLGVFRMKPLGKVPGTNLYGCELCNKTFQVKHTVYRHIKEVHRKMIVYVDENDKEIESLNKPPVLFTCEECGEAFNTRRNLEGHKKGHARMSFVATTNGSNGNKSLLNSQRSVPNILNENNRHDEDPFDDDDDDDIGDHDGIDDEIVDDFPGDEDFVEDEQEDDIDFQEGDAPSSGLGIPYRCPYGICPQFFTTKDLMHNHLKTTHGVRLELVPLSAPRVRASLPPAGFNQQSQNKASYPSTSLPVVAHPHINSNPPNSEKRFPCTYNGCQSAFTRRDRLNLHIRTKHDSVPHDIPSSSSSGSHNNSSHLRVKLPVIENDCMKIAEASKLLAQQISASRDKGVSYEPESGLGRNGKPLINPKKYPCDVPGCDKTYTKGSHVKRHKLSAHPHLFDDSQPQPSVDSNSDIRSTQESLGYFDDEEEDDFNDYEQEEASPNKKAKVSPVTETSSLQGSRTRPRR